MHPEAGGAESYIQNLSSEFVNLGNEVTIYSSSFPGGKHKEEI